MNIINFSAPFEDSKMEYDYNKHRYILKQSYLNSLGIELSAILNTDTAPVPADVPELFLDRVSLLVYSNIYSYGRARKDKEYLMACNPDFRDVICDAMVERVGYIKDSGDLSTKTGALIQQGTRVETKDLVASPQEQDLLRATGLLHRGSFYFVKDDSIEY